MILDKPLKEWCDVIKYLVAYQSYFQETSDSSNLTVQHNIICSFKVRVAITGRTAIIV